VSTFARLAAASFELLLGTWTSLHARRFRLSMLTVALAANLVPTPLLADDASASHCGQTHFENARVEAIDSNEANLSIRDCIQAAPNGPAVCSCPIVNIKVDNLALRAKLASVRPGDHIRLDLKEDKGSIQLQDVRGPWSVEVGATRRLLILTLSASLILALATAVTKGAPMKFIVGMDNRYSNSKFQLALWFWIVISTYIATIVFRVWYAGWNFFGAVNIPQNLLVLSGLSALTYGGAKAITTAKVNAAANPIQPVAGAVALPPNPDPKNALQPGQERFFRDLVQNDVGGFDFGDFQMLVVTFLAIAMYLILIFHFLGSIDSTKTLTLPDVDTTILSAFGLGQGAYLAKKAAGNVGTS
jgi:hypothetical protein